MELSRRGLIGMLFSGLGAIAGAVVLPKVTTTKHLYGRCQSVVGKAWVAAKDANERYTYDLTWIGDGNVNPEVLRVQSRHAPEVFLPYVKKNGFTQKVLGAVVADILPSEIGDVHASAYDPSECSSAILRIPA